MLNGSSLAAANIIRALSVPKVVRLPLISHLFETSMNSSAQSSALCRECFCFDFQCKRSQFPYIVNKMNCDTQVIVISDWRPVVTSKGDAGSLFEELNFSCSLAVIQRQIVRISPEAIRITSISPLSSTMFMGRQSPATQMVTFSQTGRVIFLEKSWSVGWRSSNLGLLSVGCFALR